MNFSVADENYFFKNSIRKTKWLTKITMLRVRRRASQNLAEKKNLIYRLISVDGEKFFGYPEDTRDDRLCVEIEQNLVVKATIQ